MERADKYREVGYKYHCYECGFADKKSTISIRKKCPKCGKIFGFTVIEMTDEKLN